MIRVRSELAHVLGVDPEVGLQRHLDLDAGRHVDERPAAPDRRVEGRKLVVVGRDDPTEVGPDNLGVLAQGGVHVAEDDPLLLEVLAVAVVDDLRLVLGGDAGQVLALGLGDAELLVGVLDRLGDHVPVVDERFGGLDVIEDVVEVDPRHVAAPGGHRTPLEAVVRLQPEFAHPVRLALHPGDLLDDSFVEALLGLEDVVLLVAPAELVAAEVESEVSGGVGGGHGPGCLQCGCRAAGSRPENFSYVHSNNSRAGPVGKPSVSRQPPGGAGGPASPAGWRSPGDRGGGGGRHG
jgi:hypothetical protein